MSLLKSKAMRVLDWVMVILLSLVLAIALHGCGGQKTKTVILPKEVKVPVAVPCKTPDVKKPDFYLDKDVVLATRADKARAMAGEIEQRRGYEKPLEAALNSCSTDPTSSGPVDAAKEKPRP